MTDQNRDSSPRVDGWLIVKRDLYYRPDLCGYTGIRDEAGRYSLDVAKSHADPQSGVSIVHEDDAPEFTTSCYADLMQAHLTKQRTTLEAENARLESAWAEAEGKLSTAKHERDVAREENARLRGVVEAARWLSDQPYRDAAWDALRTALDKLDTQAN